MVAAPNGPALAVTVSLMATQNNTEQHPNTTKSGLPCRPCANSPFQKANKTKKQDQGGHQDNPKTKTTTKTNTEEKPKTDTKIQPKTEHKTREKNIPNTNTVDKPMPRQTPDQDNPKAIPTQKRNQRQTPSPNPQPNEDA